MRQDRTRQIRILFYFKEKMEIGNITFVPVWNFRVFVLWWLFYIEKLCGLCIVCKCYVCAWWLGGGWIIIKILVSPMQFLDGF